MVGTNSAELQYYLVPPSVFQFQKYEQLKFLVIHRTSMGSDWFTSTFVNFLKFPQIKEGGPNFLDGTNSAKWLNYLIPLLYFNFRNFRESNSLSFIALQWVPIDSPVLLSIFWNFFKLKTGDLISWWEPVVQNGWIIWSPLLYFNFRNLRDRSSSSFVRFQ